VLHECVTCKTLVGCYVVGTTQVEYVLFVIVPQSLVMAYKAFTNKTREDYLHWLFVPGTNDFDETLSRMPKYRQTDIAWGHAKDADAVRCRVGVMMCLYALRKQQGTPLLPSDRLIPRLVSMWNIGKGAIDDMSQVLASCLPTFGPIDGICWIWVRTDLDGDAVQRMAFERHACSVRKCGLRAMRHAEATNDHGKYHGKSFVEF
jgi:hypothetical protein